MLWSDLAASDEARLSVRSTVFAKFVVSFADSPSLRT